MIFPLIAPAPRRMMAPGTLGHTAGDVVARISGDGSHMKYGITRRIHGERVFVDISKESFDEAATAKSNLVQYLFMEEKLDYVLGNFYEFEREMLEAALGHVFSFDINWSKGVAQLHAINRRLVNLLAACRLYLDHVVHHIHEIHGESSPLAAAVAAKKREEYDRHLPYRVLEAMRNYVQHRGFPVHMVTRHSALVGDGPGAPAKHAVTPWVRVETLARDGKFKTSVLNELMALGDKVDIKPLVREYIESIGRIHGTIREGLQEDADKWEGVLENVVARFREAGGTELVGLALVGIADSGSWVEHVEVFDDLVRRRVELARKNKHLTHFAGHFVTSEVCRR